MTVFSFTKIEALEDTLCCQKRWNEVQTCICQPQVLPSCWGWGEDNQASFWPQAMTSLMAYTYSLMISW